MPFALSLTFIIRHRSSYLTGTLGAAVHNPVLLILKETAVLPAHALVFDVLHVPQHLLHHSVLLSLTDRCTARQMDKRSKGGNTSVNVFHMQINKGDLNYNGMSTLLYSRGIMFLAFENRKLYPWQSWMIYSLRPLDLGSYFAFPAIKSLMITCG